MAVLEVRGVKKSFGGLMALAGVDLEIQEGQIHCIIGPNGAGKTTLFNVVSGFYSSDQGQVFFKGQNISGLSPQAIVKMGLGRSFQITKIFPGLSIFENIQTSILYSSGLGLKFFAPAEKLRREETEEILTMVGLKDRADEIAGILPAGDRKRLELGIVLGSKPDLLLLDEPTCGMSHIETSNTIDLIQKISETRELSVLFTEHKMDMVFSIASYITVMNFGAVIAAGKPDVIRNNKRVQEVYFGEDKCF